MGWAESCFKTAGPKVFGKIVKADPAAEFRR